jgi:hypothetical protein
VRLVTVTGPGGAGKTRLALAVTDLLAARFSGGACWVELAAVERPEHVASTIARTCSHAAPRRVPHEALRRFLAEKRLLLAIDNFEHLLDAAGVAADLISGCPQLTVLTTRREALDLSAEHRFVVLPLPVPARPEKATAAEIERTGGTAMLLSAIRGTTRDSRSGRAAHPRSRGSSRSSTACRWPWSSLRRRPGSSGRTASRSDSIRFQQRSARARATRPTASVRCARRSTGATGCSPATCEPHSRTSACSPAGRHTTRPRP